MTRWALIAACAFAPGAALSACPMPNAPSATQAPAPLLPAPPDTASRPVLPACLEGLSAPNQEDCTAEEIASYAGAVDSYRTALQDYIAGADRYAAQSVAYANAAIEAAEAAQAYSDAVYAYAECEAAEIRSQTE